MSVELIQILAIDMYAPALPSMAEAFGVTALYLNNTVFSFLLFSTLATVLAGPISDRFGRKPVFLSGCTLFAAGSFLCSVAPSVEVLIAARAIEALGCGSSITLSAALVQDAYKGDDLKLAMTLLQSLVIAGPVLAPFLGSFAVSHVGWRGIFWGLTVGGVVTVVLAGLIDETYDAAANAGKKLGATLVSMLKGAKTLLANRSFTALALFIGVTGIPFFAFIAVSPYILLDDFGLSYLGYSFIYAGACLTNMVAPFLYMRLSRTLVLLDQPPNVVGTASAFGNFSYGVITALATVAAAFPWPTFTFGLVVLTACSGAVAAALYAIGHRGW